jgi:PAS domain S-box-containing protein
VATFVDLYRLRHRVEDQARLLLESEKREKEFRIAQLQLKSLQRYRGLANAIPHIVLKAKADGTMDYFNEYWCQYTGLTEDQSRGDGWNASFYPDDFSQFREKWMLSRATGELFKIECRIRDREGNNRWHLLCFTPERENDGEIVSWIGTGTDIHDLKEAQEKLSMTNDWLEARVKERTEELRATNESLKKAQREVVDISEKERSRLGQDLHDGLAQELTGACFMIQSIKNNVGKVPTPKAEKVIETAFQMMKNALENCRRLAKTLYPVELERYGLAMALRELTLSTAKIFDTNCEFYLEGPETVEENEIVETQLYRIVQEGVQNAVRHSQAKHIHVIMANQEDRLILQVRDDGTGLPAPEDGTGMGFRIMRHRAQMIGAELSIESEPRKGTSIRCVWPRYESSASFDLKTRTQIVPAV